MRKLSYLFTSFYSLGMLISPFSWGMLIHTPGTQKKAADAATITQQKAADAATTPAGGPMVLDPYNASESARSIADEGWRLRELARADRDRALNDAETALVAGDLALHDAEAARADMYNADVERFLSLWGIANKTEQMCAAMAVYVRTGDIGELARSLRAILFHIGLTGDPESQVHTLLASDGFALALTPGNPTADICYNAVSMNAALLRVTETGRNAADWLYVISNLRAMINGTKNAIRNRTQRVKVEMDNMLGFMRTTSEKSGTISKQTPYDPDINKAVISGNIHGAKALLCLIEVCTAEALMTYLEGSATFVPFHVLYQTLTTSFACISIAGSV